ncbi:histone deacetylase [Parashewanella curva]|uniref:Histone deacetylase n=1 Tax=Parashewanella curva TaxID=2338552 RepID=A0A3L8PY37_9GAMM|nr:histone deacetylase [Parashewanella curva]RLV60336.1 histone deacetylase [Parashewanella curva]
MLPLIYHSSYSDLDLPKNHRFPTSKYRDIYQYLLDNKLAVPAQFYSPTPVSIDDIKTIHCPDYVDQLFTNTINPKAMRRIGFPWSEKLMVRSRHSLAGTALTAKLAIEHGRAIHLTGGYHHAHYNFGSGFCVFNDLIFAATQALKEPNIEKVLIFDCDVHQGDGTATMAQDNDKIITCSLHCAKNFPARKAQSSYDIELEKGTSSDEYLTTVEETLSLLIRLHQPDLILYDAGVDIHQDDDLGYLNICDQGIAKRDELVFSTAAKNDIPVAAVIGGGYSRDRQQLINRHFHLIQQATKLCASMACPN